MDVNKTELAKILGYSARTLTTLQSEEGLPIKRKAKKRGEQNLYDTAEVIRFLIDREVGKVTAKQGAAATTLDQENIRLTRLKADKLQLEYELLEKSVLPADEVKAAWQDEILRFKAKLLNLPGKLAARVVGQKEYGLVEGLIEDEIHGALTELSGNDDRTTAPKRPHASRAGRSKKKPAATAKAKSKPVGRKKPRS